MNDTVSSFSCQGLFYVVVKPTVDGETDGGERSKENKKTGNRRNPGPRPKIIKIDGDWEEAVKKAIKKKRPPEGWPK